MLIRLLVVAMLAAWPAMAQDRSPMQMRAKINGKTAVLVLDTGATGVVLFHSSAARLKLDVAPGEMAADGTAKQGTAVALASMPTIELAGQPVETRVEVLAVPPTLRLGVDGLIGWEAIRDRVFYVKRGAGLVVVLDAVPGELEGFQEWKIDPEQQVLTALVPDGDATVAVAFDSGQVFGVGLSPARWQAWLAADPERRYTLNASYRTGKGIQVTRQYFADRLPLGELVIAHQPVESVAAADGPAAVLGARALDRLEIVIDGPSGTLYTKAATDLRTRFEYNRLGAVFAPVDMEQVDLVATVAPNSPAAAAGIRDGDRLLAVADLDCTAWRTDPRVMPISRFFDLPAGTKIPLTLGRGTETYTVEVTLAEIFPGAVPAEE